MLGQIQAQKNGASADVSAGDAKSMAGFKSFLTAIKLSSSLSWKRSLPSQLSAAEYASNAKIGKLYDNMAVDWPISVLISMMTMPKVSLHAAQIQKENKKAKGLVKGAPCSARSRPR